MPSRLPPEWRSVYDRSRYRLRFELGGDVYGTDMPVPRFLQALRRATAIVEDAFRASRDIVGVVTVSSGPDVDFWTGSSDGFADLMAAGFVARPFAEWAAPLWPEEADEDLVSADWRAFDLSADPVSRDVLVWCALAREMAVKPAAPVMWFLVDPARLIVARVYDDRGMDVAAPQPEPLMPLYATRDDWILEYDRKRIEAAFGPLPRAGPAVT